MQLSAFRRAGHLPTLVASLLHFDVSFMIWVMLGALAPFITEDLGLSASQQGFLVAVPLLGAAVFRIALGLLGDRFGQRRVGIASLAVCLAPLLVGWLAADGLAPLVLVGLLLGVAGASFAIALPLASRWYPPEHQGLAMGIAGAGNSGTVITTLFAPRLAEAYGWQAVFGLAIIPIAVVLVAFVLLAREAPRTGPAPQTGRVMRETLREGDAWKLCALYAVTFGGFVGLASFLPSYFVDQYGFSKVDAGTLTAIGAVAGSLLRPVGGRFADRLGGTSVLLGVYVVAVLLFALQATLPAAALAIAGFWVAMGVLGVGNGAVFQLVGLRYGERIGAVTGLVGAAGGLGGFFLPTILGTLKDAVGTYAAGMGVLAGLALVALVGLQLMRGAWRASWTGSEPEGVRV